jgi:hypothetical protein
MNTQTQRLEAVERRLEKVEGRNHVLAKQNRWLKLTAAAAVLLIGVVVLVGAAPPRAVIRAAAPPKELKAQRFTVVDAKGKIRATLGMDKGAPVLYLYNDKNQANAILSLTAGSRLTLWDNNHKANLKLQGATGITLRDATGAVTWEAP